MQLMPITSSRFFELEAPVSCLGRKTNKLRFYGFLNEYTIAAAFFKFILEVT